MPSTCDKDAMGLLCFGKRTVSNLDLTVLLDGFSPTDWIEM
jgi:hypothetical protein